jgi:tRNA(Ile)-lysidine synthetase-like protein
MPCGIHAITIDHKLRPESTVEANRVHTILHQQYCYRPVQHVILTAPENSTTGNSAKWTEESARALRMRMLHAYCVERNISRLLLAHHQRDQVETILFRLSRGSDLFGLVGIHKQHSFGYPPLCLTRPLLHIAKSDIESASEQCGLHYVTDSSNSDLRFTRNKIRHDLCSMKEQGIVSADFDAHVASLGEYVEDKLKAFFNHKDTVAFFHHGISIEWGMYGIESISIRLSSFLQFRHLERLLLLKYILRCMDAQTMRGSFYERLLTFMEVREERTFSSGFIRGRKVRDVRKEYWAYLQHSRSATE